MLRAEKLDVGYRRKVVLKGVEIHVEQGKLTAVLGPNASGKSTLLKTLARLLKPVNGVVYLNNLDIKRYSRKTLARKIGVVLTEQINPRMMTGFDIVALGRYAYTDMIGRLTTYDKEVVKESLNAVGADYLSDRPFTELSDGEKQKIMIARALAQKPEILILDEPTTHLDAKNRIEILLLLKRIAKERNIAVIASLHDVELALRVADKLIIVRDNTVRCYESPEEFVEENAVEQLYDIGDRVRFNTLTYSLELVHGNGAEQVSVFIIAGAGTGAKVYRALARAGYKIKTGILHINDIDYVIAESLGIEIIAEKPYNPISGEVFQKALEAISSVDVVLYTFPPIGSSNKLNLNLLEKAMLQGKKIIGVKQNGDREDNQAPHGSVEIISLHQLQNHLKKNMKKLLLERSL